MPKLDLCFANFLSICNELGAIKRGHRAGHHKLMGNATGCKFSAPEIAQFKGAIDQLIVIGSHIIAKALLVDFGRLQTCSGQPSAAFDGGQCEGMWPVFLAMHSQAQTGAIEKPPLCIKPCRAD